MAFACWCPGIEDKNAVIENTEEEHNIKLDGKTLEQVKSYKHLREVMNINGNLEDEIINENKVKTGRLFSNIK